MDSTLRAEDLDTLLTHAESPCVSIFMPTHRGGPAVQQDPIRFKNLLREADQRLTALGLRPPRVGEMLAPGRALLEQSSFWRHQGDGLAVFLAPGMAHVHRLPLKLEEVVIVGARFHVKPLLRVLSGDGRFYVLTLSQHGVRLLQCTRDSVSDVPLDTVPKSVADALQYDAPERQIGFHAGTPGVGGRGAIFHGHGHGPDDVKDDIFQYFRRVDAGVTDVLRDERAPLVLAGVEYLLPIYRRASTYRHLAGDAVAVHPDGMKDERLHANAWAIVQPAFEKAEAEAAVRYRELAGTGKTSADLEETIVAATAGRVDVLFVTEGERWGRFEAERGAVAVHDRAEPGDEDLLDLAATRTLRSRGSVYVKAPDRMPDEGPVAAVFRY
jgi:hypothetical protein